MSHKATPPQKKPQNVYLVICSKLASTRGWDSSGIFALSGLKGGFGQHIGVWENDL